MKPRYTPTRNAVCSGFFKRAFVRWFSFGFIIYVMVFVTLKLQNDPELDIEVIQQICQSPAMIRSTCQCGEQELQQSMTASPPKVRGPFGALYPARKSDPYMMKANQPPEEVPISKVKPLPNEKHHIAFVKTHKAASSTVLNILYRFARSRHLVVLLPKIGNYIHGRQLNKTSLMPPPRRRTYDILCNHAIFNHSSFSAFLPTDTQYVGIVREPFDRFVSAFYYYRYVHPMQYLRSVPGAHENILLNFLSSPWFYEPKKPMDSMTNNRMAVDFGFPPTLFYNETAFDQYLLHLNRTFSLVMVSERFDESLVILKRLMNWNHKDILYRVKNRSKVKGKERVNVKRYKKTYSKLYHLDNKLYDLFSKKLDRQIRILGQDFTEEVEQFQKLKNDVSEFCTTNRKVGRKAFKGSKWSDTFVVNRADCTFLNLEEIQFLSYVRNVQLQSLRNTGLNKDFWNSLPTYV